ISWRAREAAFCDVQTQRDVERARLVATGTEIAAWIIVGTLDTVRGKSALVGWSRRSYKPFMRAIVRQRATAWDEAGDVYGGGSRDPRRRCRRHAPGDRW